jgi:hypothetical protein
MRLKTTAKQIRRNDEADCLKSLWILPPYKLPYFYTIDNRMRGTYTQIFKSSTIISLVYPHFDIEKSFRVAVTQ